jgi:hypothetical protein
MMAAATTNPDRSEADNEDIRAFSDEPLCGRQTDAAATAGDHRHFAL